MSCFRIRQAMNLYRLLPAYAIIHTQSRERKELIIDEIFHWKKCAAIRQITLFDTLTKLLLDYPEYRNLLQYRLRYSGGGIRRLAERCAIGILFPRYETLYISTWEEAGARLFIQHGFATVISAKKIGADCHINQQVTIGFSKSDEPPTIGDHVSIYCGAKVLGKVRVGNNTDIGANAVVIRDVESAVVVGGVPARVIKHKQERL